MAKKLVAELIGTFWLVLGGCGSAVLAAGFMSGDPNPIHLGIGFVGVSLAFGLTVMTMVYAIGHISGCHLNPAVSIGLCLGGRFPSAQLLPYILVQVVGGILGAAALYVIASGQVGFDAGGFASNGYGDFSPGHYDLTSVFLCEVLMTFMFLFIILGATHKNAPANLAGVAIGLGLTLIHLVSIPVSNTSVNPARSLATAIFARTDALPQVWLFWVAPIIGAALAGVVWKWLGKDAEA
jgi:aquaporin Z